MSKHESRPDRGATRTLWLGGLMSLAIAAAAIWVAFDLGGHPDADGRPQVALGSPGAAHAAAPATRPMAPALPPIAADAKADEEPLATF